MSKLILVLFAMLGATKAQSCGLNQYSIDDGLTCLCIPDYTAVATDICCGPNEAYNGNACECKPTFVPNPDAPGCQCPLYQQVYNQAIGCECMTGLFNDSTGHCCPQNERFNGSQCDCLPTLSRDVNGICSCSGLNVQLNNGQCECTPGTAKLQSGLCCGTHEIDVNGTCQCERGFILDPVVDQCVCPFTQLLTTNGTCVCAPEYSHPDNSTLCCHLFEHQVNETSCDCLPGLTRNPISLMCMCPKNSYYTGVSCECIVSFDRDPTGVCCGPNEVGDGNGNCVCKPTFEWGPVTGHCLCLPHSSIDNSSCVCDAGFIRNANGYCVCPDGEVLDGNSCICNATKGHIRDPVTHVCGCGAREIFVNDFCQCAVGYVRNNITQQCQPIGGWTFEPVSKYCANNASSLNCTDLIPYRGQNVTDAIQNLFGRIFVIVEWNFGNINNIVVQFFNEIIAIIGDPSQQLKDKITEFVDYTVVSCPHHLAAISSCSNVNITVVSDAQIYISSQQFGLDLMAYPCPN